MKYLLFTTTTCPKCPAVKNFVAEKITFPGEVLDERVAGFGVRAVQFSVEAAPTLIVFDDSDQEIFRGNEVQEIEEFLTRQK
ncbi:MAG: hypothetical protein V2A63_01865 [Patescibacteria group bacterium]